MHIIEGIASSVTQPTRRVNTSGTAASPERGKQLWDAGGFRDAFCGREDRSRTAGAEAVQRADGCGTAKQNQRRSFWFWLNVACITADAMPSTC